MLKTEKRRQEVTKRLTVIKRECEIRDELEDGGIV
jgi:hypothetical protein